LAGLEGIREVEIAPIIVSSGEWFGHGSYIESIKRMFDQQSMLKSPFHIQNSSDVPSACRYGDHIGSDAAAIFFYSWRNNRHEAGKYISLNKKLTDVGIFYAVDTFVNHGLAIGSKGGITSRSEFFVTASSAVLTDPKLNGDNALAMYKRDQTELPLQEAFFRTTQYDKFQNLVDSFRSQGFGEEWINKHVINEPDSEKFREWLKTREYKSASIDQMQPTQTNVNNKFIWTSSLSS
jgi:hypothetical protein